MKHKIIKGLLLVFISIFLNGCEKNFHNSLLNNKIPSSKIFFSRGPVKENCPSKEMCIIQSDGSNQTTIRRKEGFYFSGIWSPDGRKLAFTQYNYESSKIYITDYRGKNELVLTNDFVRSSEPSWSPDGKWIVFSSGTSYSDDGIYIMRTDGSNKVKIAFTSNWDFSPIWSPDGKNIAFISRPDYGTKIVVSPKANLDIYIVNVETKNLIRLTDNPYSDGEFSWSPDGKEIVYTSWRGDYEIFVIDINTKSNIRLTNSRYPNCGHPSWSPDGRKIAFVSDGILYLMNPDGKNQIRLTEKNISVSMGGLGSPSWSPDSKKIAFVANDDIYIIDIDTNTLKNLTNTPDWWDSYPLWRPIAKD